MAEFGYSGVDKQGKRVKGQLEATSEGDCRLLLRGMGIRPTKITKGILAQKDLGSFFNRAKKGRVPIAVLVQFTRQLGVLISSGVPLVQALDILGEQLAGRMKDISLALKEKVSSGSYLWESLAGYPDVFPKLYVALIKAGESSGAIEQMLKRLTRYLEDAEHLRKILKSAMMYPIIVIAIGIGVVSLMMVFVIPKFEELLKNNNQELPGPTQFVINMSHFMVNNLLYLIVAGGVGGYLIFKYIKSPEGRALLDRVTFNMPLFGPLAQKAGVARFTRTLQTLLSSGVNLIDAIDICKMTIDNVVLEEAMSKIRVDIESGKTLGMVINKITIFPKMATQMIMVGESTGALDKMLEKVADYYEADVENLIGGLTKLIEPLILVFLGGTVGGLMIALYLPIFKMASGSSG